MIEFLKKNGYNFIIICFTFAIICFILEYIGTFGQKGKNFSFFFNALLICYLIIVVISFTPILKNILSGEIKSIKSNLIKYIIFAFFLINFILYGVINNIMYVNKDAPSIIYHINFIITSIIFSVLFIILFNSTIYNIIIKKSINLFGTSINYLNIINIINMLFILCNIPILLVLHNKRAHHPIDISS